MGRYPVTNLEYERFFKENLNVSEPKFWAERQFNDPRQPVVGVSWEDARQYAKWAGLRLPSESEWEYACRAGTSTAYYNGNTPEDLARVGWYIKNAEGHAHPVGEKEPNSFGLYDMLGNVWEWVEDEWFGKYIRAPLDGRPNVGAKKRWYRVIRGGSWSYESEDCRSASRFRQKPDARYFSLGFRLAKSV